MIPALVDTHAHLDDPGLRGDLAGVLDRARAARGRPGRGHRHDGRRQRRGRRAGPAPSRASSRRSASIPTRPPRPRPGDWERVVALAGRAAGRRHRRDRARPLPGPDALRLQQQMVRPAPGPGPRARPAGRDPLPRLRARHHRPARAARPAGPGVLHSFTGTWDDAQAFLDLGLHLSFAGMVTFTNKGLDALRDVAARVPLDRLLVETDSPYLSPHPFRGRTNEPGRGRADGRTHSPSSAASLPPSSPARPRRTRDDSSYCPTTTCSDAPHPLGCRPQSSPDS